jgi:membrane protein required for colicin V production
VDAIVIVLLLICAVRGFVRGLFREAMGLAGLVLGAAVAVMYWRPAAAALQEHLGLGPVLGQLGAALTIFTVVNLLTHLLALLLDRLARTVFLGGVTRLAGAMVGIGKAAVAAGFLLLALRSFAPFPQVADAIETSALAAPLADVAAQLLRAGSDAMGSPGGSAA